MTDPSGSDDRPKRPILVPAIGLVLATGLGVTALLGGLNEKPDLKPPDVAAGKTIKMGLFEAEAVSSQVRVQRATTSFGEDKRFLDLTFKVKNVGEQTTPVGMPPIGGKALSTTFAGALLKITPPIKSEFATAHVAGKGQSQSGQLHPGVASTVIVSYQVDQTFQPPEKLVVEVGGQELAEGHIDTRESWWPVYEDSPGPLVRKVLAQVTIPVKAGDGA